MMSQTPIRLLELETKLAEDQGGTYRDSVCESLNTELAALKQHIRAGLPPDQFEQAKALEAALESAASAVQKLWKIEQNSGA